MRLFTLCMMLISSTLFSYLSAQELSDTAISATLFCGAEQIEQGYDIQHPAILLKKQALETQYYQQFSKANFSPSSSDYTLPVVVHIIHNNGTENISDEQVYQGIEYLNKAFANLEPYHPETGVDTKIQFCLAQRTPDGLPTNGITRTVSELTYGCPGEDSCLSPSELIEWNQEKYINIYVVKNIIGGSAGYASLAGEIVAEAPYMGTNSRTSIVLVHEMGHYLGLNHTFYRGCFNEDCLRDGDQVCDTPPDNSTASVACNQEMNSCMTDVNPLDSNNPFIQDQADMTYNYMDYGWSCYSAFTQGQVHRMTFFLEQVATLKSITKSNACTAPCTTEVIAQLSVDTTTISVGTSLQFTNQSTNALYANWQIYGQSFSTQWHATYTFEQAGLFPVILEASTDHPECTRTDTVFIEVVCPIEVSMDALPSTVSLGETLTISGTISPSVSGQWTINGQAMGNATAFDYTFSEAGSYVVILTSSNGLCHKIATKTIIATDPCNSSEETFAYEYASADIFGNSRTHISYSPDGHIFNCHIIYNNVNFFGFITKMTTDGSILWTKKLETATNDFYKVMATTDGGCVITSTQGTSSPSRIYQIFYKFDKNGQLEWLKKYLIPSYDVYDSFRIENMVELANGELMFTGLLSHNALPLDYEDNVRGMVFKLSAVGDWIWAKNLLSETPRQSIRFSKIIALEDGSCLVAGRFNLLDEEMSGIILLNIDSDGNEQWIKYYTVDSYVSYLHSLSLLQDNIFISGTASGRPFILKTNANGQLLWSKKYITSGRTINKGNMAATSDGLILFIEEYYTGATGFIDSSNSVYFKINPQGDPIWVKKTPTNQNGSDQNFDDIIVHPESQNIIFLKGGKWEFSGLDMPRLFTFIKADANGYAGDCISSPDEVDVTNLSLFSADFDWVWSNHDMLLEDDTPHIEDLELSRRSLCPRQIPDARLRTNSINHCGTEQRIQLEICNEGYAPLTAEVPIAFYDADPNTTTTANLLYVQNLGESILPDSCQQLTFVLPDHPATTVFALINNNGGSVPPFEECNFYNNIDHIELGMPYESPVLDLGNDTILCIGATLVLKAPTGFMNYHWQNGHTDSLFLVETPGSYQIIATDSCGVQQVDEILVSPPSETPVLELGGDVMICPQSLHTFSAGAGFEVYQWSDFTNETDLTAWLPGRYWVDVWDACGQHQSDTVQVLLDSTLVFDLGKDKVICEGDTVHLHTPTGFAAYEWQPDESVTCATCTTAIVQPTTTTTHSLIATNEQGCYSSDTIRIEVQPSIDTFLSLAILDGDSITVGTSTYTQTGSYTDTLTAANGCDSLVYLELTVLTSVEEVDHLLAFRVYPNPFSEQLSVALDLPYSQVVELKVVDVYGRVVAVLQNDRWAAGKQELAWSTADWVAGVYWLIYQSDLGYGVEMVVKQ